MFFHDVGKFLAGAVFENLTDFKMSRDVVAPLAGRVRIGGKSGIQNILKLVCNVIAAHAEKF